MALPTVKSLQDCADYHQVFEPYLPQLYTLPDRIFATLSDVDGLKDIYTSTNPAISGLAFAIALMPVFLLVSEINRNFSQVDRVWSLLPTVYHAHYALWARLNDMDTQKVDNVLAFSVVWSLRLTFNYWRKGGYEIGSEDYRWNIIKDKIGAFGLFILNIIFISSVQSVSPSFQLPCTSSLLLIIFLPLFRSYSGQSQHQPTSSSFPPASLPPCKPRTTSSRAP